MCMPHPSNQESAVEASCAMAAEPRDLVRLRWEGRQLRSQGWHLFGVVTIVIQMN